MKTTVVMWNIKTLRNSFARQQVMQWIPKDATVKERLWDNGEILLYSLQHEVIHIEWNGVNHYASLVPKRLVRIDASLMAMLSQEAAPCTQLKPHCKQAGEADASAMLQSPPKKQKRREVNHVATCHIGTEKSLVWLKIPDAVCGHSWTRIIQANLPHDSPIDALQKECLRRKCNAFIINKTELAVQFVSYSFQVLISDCAQPGDFKADTYVCNSLAKAEAAPALHCVCNVHYGKHIENITCDKCTRVCHLACTKLAGFSQKELHGVDSFVCSVCEADAHDVD
eukprot:2806718-Prymnesium_polylepis.1